MLLELSLRLLVTLFRQTLLLGKLTELQLIESHVPVDCLLVFELFLPRVVRHNKGLRLRSINTLQSILLDKLPGQFLLVLATQLVSAALNIS